MEFIDEEQYNEILEIPSDNNEKTENFIDFESDLKADFFKAIAHIQAYLFKKGIIYPKYLLEDYFSLIQTNDLIILAGDSGSGKTKLVKSFADAVGGKSIIIPVNQAGQAQKTCLATITHYKKPIYLHHF